jgi:transcription termination factor Rho
MAKKGLGGRQRRNTSQGQSSGRGGKSRSSNRGNRPGSRRNKPNAPRNGSSGNKEPVDPDTFYKSEGVLEMHPNGYGFLRDPKSNYDRQLSDPFVPGSMIEKFGFREGLQISGTAQPGR